MAKTFLFGKLTNASLPEGKKLLLPPLAYQRFRPHSFSQQQQALSNVTTPTGGEESLGTRLMLP